MREPKYCAALWSAEQFLLKEDIFFPEVWQTPESAGSSPEAGQARQAGAGVVHPPPGEGHSVTQGVAVVSHVSHGGAHPEAADPEADGAAHPGPALLVSLTGLHSTQH